MNQERIPRSLAVKLTGSTAIDSDIALLKSKFAGFMLPDWLLGLLQTYKLSGTCFSLSEDDDLSGLGAEVIWLSAAQMISAAFDVQPGIDVVPAGLIPIGNCASGSGDPYFLDMRGPTEDPPFLRVPHDYAGGGTYPLNKIEIVTSSLGGFFSKAVV